MTRVEFVAELAKTLDWSDSTLEESTVLSGHDKWDSIGRLSTMTFVDEEFGLTLASKALDGVATVKDLVDLISDRLE